LSSQENCERRVTDAALITAVLPRNTMKRLALLMGAPLDTARHWLYRHLSADRRREVCRRLLIEFDRQEAERAEIRRQLQAIVGGAEVAGGVDGDGAAVGREADHGSRPKAGAMGGAVADR
jgi:hypothetical protein